MCAHSSIPEKRTASVSDSWDALCGLPHIWVMSPVGTGEHDAVQPSHCSPLFLLHHLSSAPAGFWRSKSITLGAFQERVSCQVSRAQGRCRLKVLARCLNGAGPKAGKALFIGIARLEPAGRHFSRAPQKFINDSSLLPAFYGNPVEAAPFKDIAGFIV